MLPLVFARCENLPIWRTTNYQTKLKKKKDLGKEPKIRKQNELIGFAKRDECSGRENHCSRSKKWTREVRIKK